MDHKRQVEEKDPIGRCDQYSAAKMVKDMQRCADIKSLEQKSNMVLFVIFNVRFFSPSFHLLQQTLMRKK